MPMSYSQNGEDDIVAGLFPPDFKGTLLEIGAYHPTELSNSRLLIERGWSAVLVEFSPGPVKALVKEYAGVPREPIPRVIVVAAAITAEAAHVEEFAVTDDALSSNDEQHLKLWAKEGGYYGHLWVPTMSVHALLSQFFGQRPCDFASVDTEGSSVPVAIALMQSDHRPRVMCIEHNSRQVEVMQVAQPLGYACVHMTQENMVLLCRK